MRIHPSFPISLLLSFALLGGQPTRTEACASIGRRGPVTISGEQALIVWDEARQTEHFVRTASFEVLNPWR